MTDLINHPPHYKGTRWECIEVIEAYRLGYHLGNAFKYLVRHQHKGNPRQDVEKAIWYLERFIGCSDGQDAQARAQDTVFAVGIPSAPAEAVVRSFHLPLPLHAAACSILVADASVPRYTRGVGDAVVILKHYLKETDPNLEQANA